MFGQNNRKSNTRSTFENDYIKSFYSETLVSPTAKQNNVDMKEEVVTKDDLGSYGALVGVAV